MPAAVLGNPKYDYQSTAKLQSTATGHNPLDLTNVLSKY